MAARVMVTGLTGTVAPVVARRLAESGHVVVGWDRNRVPTDEPDAIRAFLDREQPNWFFHVATGPVEWAEMIATECAGRRIGLLYISSVSVFSEKSCGPLRPDAVPDATDDYGRYKAECEARIRAKCPQVVVVRLGWQIGDAPGSNNLVDYLHKQVDERGQAEVSRRWYPSCSFLTDTAEAVCTQFNELEPAVYHLEGNPGLSLHEIAVGLNRRHGWGWTVLPADEPGRHNLMEDARLRVRPITENLPST